MVIKFMNIEQGKHKLKDFVYFCEEHSKSDIPKQE